MSLTAVCVDDSGPEVELISRILNSHGIKVVGKALDGQTAIDVITEKQPDLVTLDLQLPLVHGYDVLAAAIALEKPPLVVVASGSGQESMKRRCKELGAVEFFVKPYDDILTWRLIEAALKERGLLE